MRSEIKITFSFTVLRCRRKNLKHVDNLEKTIGSTYWRDGCSLRAATHEWKKSWNVAYCIMKSPNKGMLHKDSTYEEKKKNVLIPCMTWSICIRVWFLQWCLGYELHLNYDRFYTAAGNNAFYEGSATLRWPAIPYIVIQNLGSCLNNCEIGGIYS